MFFAVWQKYKLALCSFEIKGSWVADKTLQLQNDHLKILGLLLFLLYDTW